MWIFQETGINNFLESQFLYDNFKKLVEDAYEDEDFKMGKFEDILRKKIVRLTKEWTDNETDQKIILQDMMDRALDEKEDLDGK